MTPLRAPPQIPKGRPSVALLIHVVMDKLPDRVNGFCDSWGLNLILNN